MNFGIRNISFNAQYVVYGKKTAEDTNQAYTSKIDKLTYSRATAVQAQDYLGTEKIQEKISQLPKDTFVRFHTAILDRGGKKEEFLNFAPSLTFETSNPADYMAIKKKYGDEFCSLELSLNQEGMLDKNKINCWFDNIIDYYS